MLSGTGIDFGNSGRRLGSARRDNNATHNVDRNTCRPRESTERSGGFRSHDNSG
jgi:hypothetical protein